jgi:hypothetical protein
LSKDLNECTNTLSSTHLKTLRKFQSKFNKDLKQKKYLKNGQITHTG